MIYVGYQGIGKSSIAGKNNCIDLESSNFFVNDERITNWYEIYCNIANHLSCQGYDVFLSSHKVVRDELNKRNIDYIVICPCLELEKLWIQRLQHRYMESNLIKDFKAYRNAKDKYKENIIDLCNEKKVLQIKDINYDLFDLIKNNVFKENGEYKIRRWI